MPGVLSAHTTLVFVALTTPEGQGGPWVPLNSRSPCIPWEPGGPWGPAGRGGPWGSVPVCLLSFLLSSNLNLQNSTELTKNPSNRPALHSYLLLSVGYLL